MFAKSYQDHGLSFTSLWRSVKCFRAVLVGVLKVAVFASLLVSSGGEVKNETTERPVEVVKESVEAITQDEHFSVFHDHALATSDVPVIRHWFDSLQQGFRPRTSGHRLTPELLAPLRC